MRRYLFIVTTIALTSSLALAESDSAPTAVSLVEAQVLAPLAAKDGHRSKFSRSRLSPSERRVRVLDKTPQRDSAGKAFVAFEIDERRGWHSSEDNWNTATISGCVYSERGDVFIKRGNAFHPAAAALGKKTKAAPNTTCHPVTQLSAH